jgi:hypothetical protein
MIDPFLLLAPILLLGILALLGFVGCSFHHGAASPTVPTNLQAFPGDTWVTLTWDPDPDATDFIVHRGEMTGSYPSTFDTMQTQNSYLDLPVTDGTTYFYAVSAVTSIGPSSNSNEASATPGAIKYVQLAEIDVQVAGTTVTSNAFGTPLTAGNLIVVWIWYKIGAQPAQVSQVTDTANNSYTPVVGPTLGTGTLAGFQQEIWYAKNINGGSGVKVTATFTASTTERAISAHEYAGADQAEPLVNMPIGLASNGANATLGPLDTTIARLIFAAAIFKTQGAAGAGFNKRSGLQNNVTEDQAVTMPGLLTATFTNTAQDWVAQMVTFK